MKDYLDEKTQKGDRDFWLFTLELEIAPPNVTPSFKISGLTRHFCKDADLWGVDCIAVIMLWVLRTVVGK